jgi:SAM-dependent methyltransferase
MTSGLAPHQELNDIYAGRQMDAVAARWDNKAAGWDHALLDPACHLNEDNAYQRFLDQLALVVQQRHDFCSGLGVIDAGCATGLVLGSTLASFAWGIGVDISPEMIRLARAKHLPKARFLVADCFNLCASCPKAGAVISRGVLLSHYGPKQAEALLKSAHSCLVERGFLLWDFLNQTAQAKYRHIAENKTYFEAEEICAIAGRAGFGISRIHGEADRRVRMLYAER